MILSIIFFLLVGLFLISVHAVPFPFLPTFWLLVFAFLLCVSKFGFIIETWKLYEPKKAHSMKSKTDI